MCKCVIKVEIASEVQIQSTPMITVFFYSKGNNVFRLLLGPEDKNTYIDTQEVPIS